MASLLRPSSNTSPRACSASCALDTNGCTKFPISRTGHSCGVTTDNRAYCWGSNHSGRLGDGSFENRLSPSPVAGGLSFGGVTTSLNGFDTCGLTTGHKAYCWGGNFVGGLGDGTTRDHEVPQPVVGPT